MFHYRSIKIHEYIFSGYHFVKDSVGKDLIIDTQGKFLYTPGQMNEDKYLVVLFGEISCPLIQSNMM